jgi:AICAR transformylase/IMP cyclohydrolase PurH
MFFQALLSAYDKTDLLDLAKGLAGAGVRLLGSGLQRKLVKRYRVSSNRSIGIEHKNFKL